MVCKPVVQMQIEGLCGGSRWKPQALARSKTQRKEAVEGREISGSSPKDGHPANVSRKESIVNNHEGTST